MQAPPSIYGSHRAMTMKTSTLEKLTWIVGPLFFIGAAYVSLKISTPSHWIGAKTEDTSEWLAWFGLVALVVAVIQLIKTQKASNAAKEASERTIGAIRRLDAAHEINTAIAIADRAIEAFEKSDYPSAQRACNEWLDVLARLKPLRGELPFQPGEDLDRVNLKVTSARNNSARGVEKALEGPAPQHVMDTLREQKRIFITLEVTLRQDLSGS